MDAPIFSPNRTGDSISNASSASEPMDTTNENLNETPVPDRTRRPDTPRPGRQTRRKTGRVSGAAKAGLIFPVGRIRKYLKQLEPGHRHSNKSAVYVAAVLEYLIVELLECSKAFTVADKRKRITPRHIRQCIGTDPDFMKLLGDVIIREGGSIPYIHEALFPTETNRSKESNSKK